MKHTATVSGQLYRRIPRDYDLQLLGTDIRLKADAANVGRLDLEFEFEAGDDPLPIAQMRLDQVASALSLLLESQVDIDALPSIESTVNDSSAIGYKYLGARATIIGDPLEDGEVDRASHASAVFGSALGSRLLRAMRWRRSALSDPDPIDRFTKLWVALETGVGTTGKGHIDARATEILTRAGFRGLRRDEIAKLVGELYDWREALLHDGEIDREQSTKNCGMLREMVDAILWSQLPVRS